MGPSDPTPGSTPHLPLVPDDSAADAARGGDGTIDLESATPSAAVPPALATARSVDRQIATETKSLDPATYNQDQARDKARELIAIWLLKIFGGIVLLAFVPLIWLMIDPNSNKEMIDPLIQVLNIVVGPVVALVGSATGFYFGSQSARTDG